MEPHRRAGSGGAYQFVPLLLLLDLMNLSKQLERDSDVGEREDDETGRSGGFPRPHLLNPLRTPARAYTILEDQPEPPNDNPRLTSSSLQFSSASPQHSPSARSRCALRI